MSDEMVNEADCTEVTHESWLTRLWNSFFAILIGILLFLGSIVLLFWNEGRAVKTAKTLAEGGRSVVSARSDTVDTTLEGKLVHMSAVATPRGELTDQLFNIHATALRLQRAAVMYQWVEEKEEKNQTQVGGGTRRETTYKHEKRWVSHRVDSDKFKQPLGHENPRSMRIPGLTVTAPQVPFGAFTLPTSLVDKIHNQDKLAMNPKNLEQLPSEAWFSATGEKPILDNGTFYYGKNPAHPEIGDQQISFYITPATEVSIIARQVGSSFAPYHTQAGGDIELLATGNVSATTMFQSAIAENNFWTWLLRVVGYVLMIIGINLLFKPLDVLAEVIPFVGNIVGMGTFFIALVLATAVSLFSVALAWIFFRPLFGIVLLLLVAALVGWLRWMNPRQVSSPAANA